MDVIRNSPMILEIATRNRDGRIAVLGVGTFMLGLLTLRLTGSDMGTGAQSFGRNTSDLGLFVGGVAMFALGLHLPDRTTLVFDKSLGQVAISQARWPLAPKIVQMPLGPLLAGTVYEDEGTLHWNAGRGWSQTRSLATMGGTQKVVPVVNAWLLQARRA
jgi:hypothetical protein